LVITLDDNHALSYYSVMIVSFKDADTEALANGRRVRRFVSIESVARRKLRQLQIAGRLDDLRVPPGNRLEALKGDRAGKYSIRVNDQFRVCFRFTAAGPEDVEIVNLNVAKVEGVVDPRRQGRSCISIPRALDNKGDAAPSAFPKGKKQGGI